VKSANNADELMSILMEAMTSSLIDQDSAAAKVPIVVTASAESIAAVKHLTFWSELDQHAAELRKEAIGRLALGMDVPPEVLQGASDSNHWSAWQAARVEVAQKEEHERQEKEPVEERVVEKIVEKTDVDRSE